MVLLVVERDGRHVGAEVLEAPPHRRAVEGEPGLEGPFGLRAAHVEIAEAHATTIGRSLPGPDGPIVEA